jgi:hypothetical protein
VQASTFPVVYPAWERLKQRSPRLYLSREWWIATDDELGFPKNASMAVKFGAWTIDKSSGGVKKK